MRVLHVITGLGYGGAEQQLLSLLRHMPASCEVAALTNPGPVAEALRRDGIPVHDIGMRGNRDLAALPRLVRLIRRGGFDLVHTHLYRACIYGRIAARLAGVSTVIATEHSLNADAIEGRRTTAGVRMLYRAAERLGTATVAVSPHVVRELHRWGIPASRVTVIPNGVELARLSYDPERRTAFRTQVGIGPGEFVAGAVGRLVDGKRFDLLITAFARLPEGRLLLVGDGPERPALQDLARRLGVAERVVFTGGLADIPGALSAMDVFAAPSEAETFGLAVVEALAAGLPVLYAACPALESLPAAAAPGARQVDPQPAAWSEALQACLDAGRRRWPVPPAAYAYDIGTCSSELMRLYRAHLAPQATEQRAVRT